MKNLSKKIVSLMLIMMLVVSGVSFAGTTTVDYDSLLRDEVSTGGEKLSEGLKNADLSDEDDVRVIVELSELPIISYATERGVKLSELGSGDVDRLSNNIQSEQNMVIDEIENQDVEVEVINRFENVFNGFSVNVKYGEVEKIADLPNVKKVYIANKYDRPKPQMSNSYKLTQSRYVNQDLGMTGKGLVVSIIDSGIDPSHKDFKLDAGTKVALDKDRVDVIINENDLLGKYYTDKVPYGYNYMDKNQEIRDLGVDANMHGMHVAGTVGSNGELVGVAPNVQLLSMKVFGNDPEFPSTFGDIIVKAIDDSIKLGADVMNLSLGASASFVDPEDPEQKAVKRAVENGIIMSISAGNSAHYGSGYSKSVPYATNPDIGVVGSPGLSLDSLQVASVENHATLYINNVACDGLNMNVLGYGKDSWTNGKYKLVSIGGSKLGKPEDFKDMDLKDKVVLVSRGELSFMDKTENAFKAGAKAIIVYNNDITRFFFKDQGGWSIPFMKVQVDEGKELERLLAANGGEIEINVSTKTEYVSPTSGTLSDFSSWGVTPSLDFKPEISAPGGNIYSTLNDDRYGYKSGTSMAAPHVAGGSALVVERVNKDPNFYKFTSKNQDKAELVKNILMNTAKPVVDKEYTDENGIVTGYSYTSVRKQGAGSMDLKAAMETNVVVTEKNSGIAKVSFGEMSDSESFTLVARNFSDKDVVCSIESMAQVNVESEGYNLLKTELLKNTVTKITVNGNSIGDMVTIPANDSIEITVDMDFSRETADIIKKFPNGNFIEGFVFLKPYNEEALTNIDVLSAALNTANINIAAKEKETAVAKLALDNAKEEIARLQASKLELNAKITELDEQYKDIISKNGFVEEAFNKYMVAKSAYDKLISMYGNLNTSDEINTLNALREVKSGLETEVASIQAEIDKINKKLDEINGGSTITSGAVIVSDSEKAQLEEKLIELKIELGIKKANLEQQNIKVETQEKTVNELQNKVDGIDAAKVAVDSARVAYQNTLNTLDANDSLEIEKYIALRSEKEAKIAEIEATLIIKNTELSTLQTSFDELTASVKDLKVIAENALNALNGAGEEYSNILPLSVPFMGFYGGWETAPAFDSPLYEKDSFYKITGLYSVSKNGEGFLGEDTKGIIKADHVAISPNGDEYSDSAIPVISVHRNILDVEFNILDKDMKVLRTIAKKDSYRKTFYDGGEGKKYYYLPGMAWDGKIDMEVAPEGKYFYQIKGVLSDDEKTVKTLNFPIIVDNTAPVINDCIYRNGGSELTVKATDSGVGIKSYKLFDVTGEKPVLLETNTTGVFKMSEITTAPKLVLYAISDFAGNMKIADKPIAINDNTAPDVKLNVKAFSVINTKEFTLKGTASEFTSPTILVDGEKVETKYNEEKGVYEFEKQFKFDTDGKKGINVLSSDYMGNKVEFIRHFYLDSTPVKLTVEPSVKLSESEVNYVESNINTINFKIDAVEETFPNLEIKFNKDVIQSTTADFESYEELIKGTNFTGEKEFTLKDGKNIVLIEAEDAGGNITQVKYEIYKKVAGQEISKFTKEEYTTPDNNVSYARPLKANVEVTESSDWNIKIVDPNGETVFEDKKSDATKVDFSWNPERDNKLNGKFKCIITATNGKEQLVSEKDFDVYNFEFKLKSITTGEFGSMFNIIAEVENLDSTEYEPVVLVQVKQEDGAVISLGTAQSSVSGGKTAKLSSGMIKPKNGKYTAEVYVWTAVEDGRALSDRPSLGNGIIEFVIEE